MGKIKVCVGDKYGRLTVLQRAGSRVSSGGTSRSVWLCRCECGNTVVVPGYTLTRGTSTSCGCYADEQRKRFTDQYGGKNKTHGDKGSRLYNIWVHMKGRCNNPKNGDYADYGGRGITVCQEWNEYIPFKNWAESAGYRDDLSIDRIDVNGNYCPENCRWATDIQQARNRRSVRVIEYNGAVYNVVTFAKFLGVSHPTVSRWIKEGKTPQQMYDWANRK